LEFNFVNKIINFDIKRLALDFKIVLLISKILYQLSNIILIQIMFSMGAFYNSGYADELCAARYVECFDGKKCQNLYGLIFVFA